MGLGVGVLWWYSTGAVELGHGVLEVSACGVVEVAGTAGTELVSWTGYEGTDEVWWAG